MLYMTCIVVVQAFFSATNYSSTEDSGLVQYCVVLEGKIERTVAIGVMAIPGTAESEALSMLHCNLLQYYWTFFL